MGSEPVILVLAKYEPINYTIHPINQPIKQP